MNQRPSFEYSLLIPGCAAILLGIMMISPLGAEIQIIWVGTGILFLGLISSAIGLYHKKTTNSSGLEKRRPVTDRLFKTAAPFSPLDAARLISGSDWVAPCLGELTANFSRWFCQHNKDEDPWPAFDRWIRDALNQFLKARRIRCFRYQDKNRRLYSLINKSDETFWTNASRHGLIEHVIGSGQRYVRGAPSNGPLIEQLAAQWDSQNDAQNSDMISLRQPDWIIPIHDRNNTIGLIVVGELPPDVLTDLAQLQAFGHLLEIYWSHVHLADELTIAQRTDRTSGLMNRIDLTKFTETILQESANEGEPLVILALALEGVRGLDDHGQWELRDWLMRQIGQEIRSKLRSDDIVGRFSDDRIIVILRRLDISLGQLIARKLLDGVQATINCEPIKSASIHLRCGLAEGPGDSLEPLLTRVFRALTQAREEEKDIMIAPLVNEHPCATVTGVES